MARAQVQADKFDGQSGRTIGQAVVEVSRSGDNIYLKIVSGKRGDPQWFQVTPQQWRELNVAAELDT